MERAALLTAAFIQEIWLWYVIMSARRRCRGLWDVVEERNCYNQKDDSDSDEESPELRLDDFSSKQVQFALSNTTERVAHLNSVINLVKQMTFLDSG